MHTDKRKKKSTDPSTEGGGGHSQSSHAHQIHILCFRARVSDEMPESLKLNLAQEMQMCDATTNVRGTNVNMCRLLASKSPINSKWGRWRQSFKERELEWKLTIQTMVLIMVKMVGI